MEYGSTIENYSEKERNLQRNEWKEIEERLCRFYNIDFIQDPIFEDKLVRKTKHFIFVLDESGYMNGKSLDRFKRNTF